jgi:AhpD family alkylhydroperoxidase
MIPRYYRPQVSTGQGLSLLKNCELFDACLARHVSDRQGRYLSAFGQELIALAVAISLRCDGCISVHTAAAGKLDVSKEEMSKPLASA